MRTTKRLAFPFSLVVIHAFLAVAVFLQAMRDPERSGLLPLVIFTIDWPASPIIMFLARTIGVTSDRAGYYSGVLNDMTFFLVLGSLWWFAVGYVLLRKFRD